MTRRALLGFSLAATVLGGPPVAVSVQVSESGVIPVFTEPWAVPSRPDVAAWVAGGGGECIPGIGDRCSTPAFVVVWEHTGPEPQVFAQVFDGQGERIGEPICIGEGIAPAVATGTDGEFVVARRSSNGDLFWDWFDAAGHWLRGDRSRFGSAEGAGAVSAAGRTDRESTAPSIDVSAVSRDRYAIVWELTVDGTSLGVFLQVLGEHSALLHLTTPSGVDEAPRVSMVRSRPCIDGDGAAPSAEGRPSTELPCIVVAWQGGGGDVFVRAYSHDLTPVELDDDARVAGPFNLVSTGVQRRPAVAASEEAFSVVWESRPSARIDLVVCLDGSESIEPATFELQKQGLIAALSDPEIVPRDGSVRILVVQFTGTATAIHKPSTIVSEETVATIVDHVDQSTRLGGSTCLACCVRTASESLAESAETAEQAVLLATDGHPNPDGSGSDVASVRAAREAVRLAREAGVDFLNLIAVGKKPHPPGPLRRWVFAEPLDEDCEPPGGEDCERGFVVEAETTTDFAEVVRRTIAGESNANGSGIFARGYATAGPAEPTLGPEFQVNSFVLGDQSSPDVAAGSSRDLLVVWEDGERRRIAAQWVGTDGSLRGEEIDLAPECPEEACGETENGPRSPRVAGLPDGRFVAVWEGDTEYGGRGLFARLIVPGGLAAGGPATGGLRSSLDLATVGAGDEPAERASERGGPTVFDRPPIVDSVD